MSTTPLAEDAPHILVVDDDTRLRDLLQRYLTSEGFRVTTAENAAEARAKLQAFAFDLLILDIMMPGESGLDLASAIRERTQVPIMMLTAMGETEHRIDGLTRGADDYLTKPFEPRELVLRINAILRRVPQPQAELREEPISLGRHSFDPRRGILIAEGKEVALTPTEVVLLQTLARHPGEAVSRQDLCEAGDLDANARAIDVQVTRLRRKIEPDSKYPRYLRTVRGTGYMLMPD